MMPVLVTALAFVAMEPAAAWSHRAGMHGRGWVWHRSHHSDPPPRLQHNDLFPLLFATVAMALVALGYALDAGPLVWAMAGVSLYGLSYLLVHDVCVHGRLGRRWVHGRYLHWVSEAHERHHDTGGAPYGFLLPVRGRQRNMSRLASRSTGAIVAESSGSHG